MKSSRSPVRRFIFDGWERGADQRSLLLHYRFDDHPRMTERVSFGDDAPPLRPSATLDRLADLLHWMSGVSYYKAFCPRRVSFSGRLPDATTMAFLDTFYCAGLAEFAAINAVHIDIDWPSPGATSVGGGAMLSPGVVVPVGGGKDSLVSCNLLDQAEVDYRTIYVGGSALIRDVCEKIGKPTVRIKRQLAPELVELNAKGAFNGHVPITGILAVMMLIGGLVHGYDTIVMSNERSADEPNTWDADGQPVNHQYSKSSAFEASLQALLVHYGLSQLRYFSLLRPLYEVEIARLFAAGGQYLHEFSSCNRNFHLTGSRLDDNERWCRNCPKCRFTYLALAPHLPPDQLRQIFGGDMLADRSQLAGFAALAGLGHDKPFECVGEVGESRALIKALAQRQAYADSEIIRALSPRLPDDTPRLEALLTARGAHRMPSQFAGSIDG